MQNSKFSWLKPVNKIVLSAGHGAGDPGAVNGQHKEADQTVYMVDRCAEYLRSYGIQVDVVPHSLGLKGGIDWVNARYRWNDCWAIELHRDSANVPDWNDASTRLGVYGFAGDNGKDTNNQSMKIAEALRDEFKKLGANNKTWARNDTHARTKRLGWIRDPKPLSHLFELAFMQGDNHQGHLLWLAEITAKSLYVLLTGQELKPIEPPVIPPVIPPEPPVVPPVNQELIDFKNKVKTDLQNYINSL